MQRIKVVLLCAVMASTGWFSNYLLNSKTAYAIANKEYRLIAIPDQMFSMGQEKRAKLLEQMVNDQSKGGGWSLHSLDQSMGGRMMILVK